MGLGCRERSRFDAQSEVCCCKYCSLSEAQPHTATVEPCWPDNVAARLTLELGMFAVFFPQGQHAYDGRIQFVNYCLLRASRFFSLLTLHPVYMLTMYAVRHVIANTPVTSRLLIPPFTLQTLRKAAHLLVLASEITPLTHVWP